VPITKFLLDTGDYNSKALSVYVEAPGVGERKAEVTCEFARGSFDLRVPIGGRWHRLVKDNLEHDIDPGKSRFIVKQDKVVVKLGKVKGEYSYDNWTQLTAKKDKKAKKAKKEDPMSSINDMMKEMYDNGDDAMKKTIGEAMMKSRSGEKMEPPDMADMSDLTDV
jgi:calcyclin binding protein